MRSDQASNVDQRGNLRPGERFHQFLASGWGASEVAQADVAPVVTLVVSVEHRVGGLAHQHHPLPSSQTSEVHPLLASFACTRAYSLGHATKLLRHSSEVQETHVPHSNASTHLQGGSGSVGAPTSDLWNHLLINSPSSAFPKQ
jgi:hypothetical protein